MISHPERTGERDAAIDALLAHDGGWSMASLRAALAGSGADPADARLLFPGGTPDLIEAFADLIDRRMEQQAAATDMTAMRTPARVRAVIAARLAMLRPHRHAVRRAAGILALPRHARLAACCAARTVDAIWHAAGDRSADFSWYTKRALLGGVYATTMLFWLRDDGDDDAATLAFLDRRLQGVGRIGQVRKRMEAMAARFRPSPPATPDAGYAEA